MMATADRGSVSVWLAGVAGVVLAVGLAVMAAGSAMVGRHRAQAAADLGALAGARYASAGQTVACARARDLVVANGAELVGCLLDGSRLTVWVQLSSPVGSATARARAGPVEPVPGDPRPTAAPGPVSMTAP